MDESVEKLIEISETVYRSYAQKLLDRSLIDFNTGLPASVPSTIHSSMKSPPLTSATPQAIEEFSQRLVEELLETVVAPEPVANAASVEGEPTIRPVDSVAIIGGGVSGLYAAMMLAGNYGFKVDVIEASDRIGGRLYTHRFDNNATAPSGEWDYFDVGAMRFPDTPVMERTFNLFKFLDIPLLDYHISEESNWKLYNNVRIQVKDMKAAGPDPFKVAAIPGRPGLPEYWARQDPSQLLRQAIQPFLNALARNHEVALNNIIRHYDHFSTRSYLATRWNYPPTVINWIETMSFGTGWFDRALIETILEELAFSFNKQSPTELKWHCVRGGSRVIPERMVNWLKVNSPATGIKMNHRVTAVNFNNNRFELFGNTPANPTGAPTSFSKTYSHVIFAIPPPCIRMIDVSTCELDFNQRNALRELQLAPSSKIGIKFKTAWWTRLQGITGGQSTTDRVCRTVVYPSQGKGESTVLIASYSWTQDSLALGAMMQGKYTPAESRLKQVMLADLAEIHNIDIKVLEEEFEAMYAYDWNHNPLSIGAFGLFGPSQFRNVYPSVTRTAARGQMHFIGETFSTTHGWVAGALESAERAVFQMLKLHRIALLRMPKEEFEEEADEVPEEPRSGGVPDQGIEWGAPAPAEGQKGLPPTAGHGAPAPNDEQAAKDPLDMYLEKWHPQLMVDEDTLVKQVLKSWFLQKDEFNF